MLPFLSFSLLILCQTGWTWCVIGFVGSWMKFFSRRLPVLVRQKPFIYFHRHSFHSFASIKTCIFWKSWMFLFTDRTVFRWDFTSKRLETRLLKIKILNIDSRGTMKIQASRIQNINQMESALPEIFSIRSHFESFWSHTPVVRTQEFHKVMQRFMTSVDFQNSANLVQTGLVRSKVNL